MTIIIPAVTAETCLLLWLTLWLKDRKIAVNLCHMLSQIITVMTGLVRAHGFKKGLSTAFDIKICLCHQVDD